MRESPWGLTAKGRWVWIAAAGGVVLTLLAFYPGYMSADSIAQLHQARTGELTDWHPPAMAIVWGWLDRLVPGPGGMLLVQVLLWWGGLALAAQHPGAAPAHAVALVLLAGFWPPMFAQIGTIWKDVQMAGAFAFAAGCLAGPCRTSRGRAAHGWLIVSMVAICYGSALRHNALPAAIPLALWAGWRFAALHGLAPAGRLLSATLAGILALAMPSAVSAALVRPDKTYPEQQLLAFDLAGMSLHSGIQLIPEPIRPADLSLGELQAIYSPDTLVGLFAPERPVRHLGFTRGEAAVSELAEAWRRSVAAYPAGYLSHRTKVFGALLGFRERVFYPAHIGITPNDLGVRWEPTGLKARLAAFGNSLKGSSALRWCVDLVFRAWVYLVVALALVAVGIRLHLRGEAVGRAVAVIAASGALYELAQYLVAIAADFRFNLWLVASVLLCLVLLGASGPGSHFIRGLRRLGAGPSMTR